MGVWRTLFKLFSASLSLVIGKHKQPNGRRQASDLPLLIDLSYKVDELFILKCSDLLKAIEKICLQADAGLMTMQNNGAFEDR